MKILMLTPYLPYPPISGGQIRSLNFLKYLNKKHDITLIALYKNETEKKYENDLKRYCRRLYLCKRPTKPWQLNILAKTIFTRTPLLLVRNFSSEAQKLIQNLLAHESFDIIHSETFYIMPLIPKTDIPILLVEQTIEYKVYQHFVSTLNSLIKPFFYPDLVKLKYWEKYYWKKANLVVTVSIQDKEFIHNRLPEVNPEVIPNGADDDAFVTTLANKDLKKPKLLFTGNFAWLQNTEAAEYLINNVYPELKKVLPNLKIIIAGTLAQPKIKIPYNEDIQILGDKPLDETVMKKLYLESTLFVGPIFGPGGTNLKLLTSLASGLPVVTTEIAASRLNLVDGKNVFIANTPKEFAQKIQIILSNKTLYEQLRKNAYQFVKSEYSYEAIAQKLEKMYHSIEHYHENRH